MYTVESGDTTTKIASKFGVSLEALLAANPEVKDPNKIQTGQVLIIPEGGRSSSVGSTLSVNEVTFGGYTGDGSHHGAGHIYIDRWIDSACKAIGVAQNDNWRIGYKTLCLRESSYYPNAVNTSDMNAHGERAPDGHPFNCSRGLAQCIPPTFAKHWAPGTSTSIYDPVANIAASMNYVQTRYNVSGDGSDLARNVQQADPSRHPKGY